MIQRCTAIVIARIPTGQASDAREYVTMPCPPWESTETVAMPDPRLETAPRADLRLCARPVRRQDTTREFGVMDLRGEG